MSKRSILRALRGKPKPQEPWPEWAQILLLLFFVLVFALVIWTYPR
jgi:hypothetical protein